MLYNRPLRCDCGYREVKELITLEQYRGKDPLGILFEERAKDLLVKVNSLLQDLGFTAIIMTSGFRSPQHNAAVGGAKASKHCEAQAIDLADNDRKIGAALMANLGKVKSRGMALEDLRYCEKANGNRWVHLQSVLPKSGNTVFIPYAGAPRIT